MTKNQGPSVSVGQSGSKTVLANVLRACIVQVSTRIALLSFRRRRIPLESTKATKPKASLFIIGIFNLASTLDRQYRHTRCIACAEDIGLQLADGSSASRHARVLLLPTWHCTAPFSGGRCSGCLPCLPFPHPHCSVPQCHSAPAQCSVLSAQCSPKHNGSSCPHLLPPLSPINNPAKAAAPASHLRRLTPKLLPPFLDQHSRVRQPTVSFNFGSQHQRVHHRPRIHTVATLPRSQGPKDRPTHDSQLDRPAISSACRHRYLPPTGLVAFTTVPHNFSNRTLTDKQRNDALL